MGTSKTGRVLNTKGSERTISEYALVHSNEGTYVNVNSKDKKKNPIRLKSGGHGEATFKILKKHNIGYNIVKTYPNGVRIGTVENHKDKIKRFYNGQVWFPKEWTWKEILRAGEHVVALKSNKNAKDGEHMTGIWKGVKVVVIKRNGQPETICPSFDQPSKK